MTLAPHPFWLDGGYDFESVQACPYHPNHRWVTVRLGDVLQPGACGDPDEVMTFCQGCFVPRCDSVYKASAVGMIPGLDRCTMWRHHRTSHVYDSGHREPVGGMTSEVAGGNL